MKIFYSISIFITFVIYLNFAAIPIDQFVVNRYYCAKKLDLIDCQTVVKRKNKTAQEGKGWLQIKQPITNNISVQGIISYQDYSGKWKRLVVRQFERGCDKMQLTKEQFSRYIPDLKLDCPIKPGNYALGPTIINRYRKDWDRDMKFWFPPLWMEADNWKAEAIWYYTGFTEEESIGHVTIEYRLLNDRMSQ